MRDHEQVLTIGNIIYNFILPRIVALAANNPGYHPENLKIENLLRENPIPMDRLPSAIVIWR